MNRNRHRVPRRPRSARPAALALGLATLAQGAWLARMDAARGLALLQVALVALALAAAVRELWLARRRLDHHVDMLLVMLAFGGLGMLAGTALDGRLAKAHDAAPAMAKSTEKTDGAKRTEEAEKAAGVERTTTRTTESMGTSMGMNMGMGGAPPGSTWASLRRSLFSWMTGLMLAGGIVPTIWMTRCASLARRSWRRWVATWLAGNAGMVVGMIALGRLWGRPLGGWLGLAATGHHLAMLAGMLAGMVVAELAAEAALGVARRPLRAGPANVRNAK